MTIYCLTNEITKKQYVGQTTTDVKARWSSHKWRAGKEPRGFALSEAMKKYGVEAFMLRVLERCQTQEELNAAEIMWIKRLGTLAPNGYNIRLGGSRGKHHPQSIAKMRGRKFTPQWRARISAAAKRRGPVSAATRRKLSEAGKGRKITSEQLEKFYRGEKNPRAKLTWKQVTEIRRLYKEKRLSQQAIATRFGVNQTGIGFIVRGVTWKLPVTC